MVWVGTFYVCFSVHWGSTSHFLLLQYFRGVVWLPRYPKILNTLLMLSPHLCFIMGSICSLFVARNDSWMSWRPQRGSNKYMFFTIMELEVEGWDPVKQPSGHTTLTWRRINVDATWSVASTLIRRHFDVFCLLGSLSPTPTLHPSPSPHPQ